MREEAILRVPNRTEGGPTHRPESQAMRLQRELDERIKAMSSEQRQRFYHRMIGRAQEVGLTIEDRILLLQHPDTKEILLPTPAIFDKDTIQKRATQLEKVYTALEKVENFAFSGHPAGEHILATATAGMPEAEARLLRTARSKLTATPRRNTRYDTFGHPRSTIEINSTNPEGHHYHLALARLTTDYMQALGYDVPLLNREKNSSAHQLVTLFQQEYQERTNEPLSNVGAIYDDDNEINLLNRNEIPRLVSFFKSLGINLTIATPKDVVIKNGDLFIGEKKIMHFGEMPLIYQKH